MGLLNKIFGGGDKGSEKDIPPVMPPFPTSYDEVMRALAPYYHEQRPMDFFFEMFVVRTIEELPDATIQALGEFESKHPTFFEAFEGSWSKTVVGSLNLSDTIDVAIWDLWLKNSANARKDGWVYHPWHFASNFIENYSTDDSRVDVWTEETLAQARQRIAAHRFGR